MKDSMINQGYLKVAWFCDTCGKEIKPNHYMIIQRKGLIESHHRWCEKCFKKEPNKNRLKVRLGNNLILERHKHQPLYSKDER